MPKYRTASYLRDLAGSIVNPSGFSIDRAISSDKNFEASSANSGISVNDFVSRKDTDAIVYYGSSSEIEILEKLFSELDRPFDEVFINAVAYEVRSESSSGNAASIAMGLIDRAKGFGISIQNGNLDSSSSIKIRINEVDSIWSIFSADSRFKTVGSAGVRIRSDSTSRFQVGAEVPTLGDVSHNGNGNAVQSIIYRSSGVIIELTPDVKEDSIGLSILHQLSSFTSTTTGVNTSPTLLKRELKTSVTVSDGELIILGGLEQSIKNNNRKGVSFLPDFFTGKHDLNENTEMLLLLYVKRI